MVKRFLNISPDLRDLQTTFLNRSLRTSDMSTYAVPYKKNKAVREMTDLILGFILSLHTASN